MSREAIYSALFALVSAVPGITTASRKGRPLSDLSDPELPFLFQLQAGETWEQKKGLPPKRLLKIDLEIYVSSAEDPSEAPSSILNPILDGIEAALAPDEGDEAQTLGGLVSHCWIESGVEIWEGLLEKMVVALIPVHILIP